MYNVILVTTKDKEEARKISGVLLERKQAACVNIIPGVESMFRWDGEIQTEQECLMVIKSESKCYDAIEKTVKEFHSYDCPEVISLLIEEGNPEYLQWLSS